MRMQEPLIWQTQTWKMVFSLPSRRPTIPEAMCDDIICAMCSYGDAKYFCETKSKASCIVLSTPKNSCSLSTRLLRYTSLLCSLTVYFIVFHTIFYYYSCTFSRIQIDMHICYAKQNERERKRERKGPPNSI